MGSASAARRRQVVEELSEAFAQDRIGLADLEKRLEEAARAGSDAELRKLLDGIPPAEARIAPTGTGTPTPRGDAASSATGLTSAAGSPGRADPSQVKETLFTFAFWSGRSRKGAWIPPHRITAFAFQGGVELDFREALWGTPVTTVHAVAVMGGVHILVPPGVNVETSGFAIMGGFDDEASAGAERAAGAPTLRITGFALMGGVDVVVRHPHETERAARERKRREKRLARERSEQG